jgi:hypothetical protein
MRKGDKITREMLKTAIIACGGNISQMVKHLDLKTDGSVYYLLNNKFTDLKTFWLDVKEGRIKLEAELDTQVRELASDLPPILTRIQVEILDFIDAGNGEAVNVSDLNATSLKNLEKRGFVMLESGFAVLTEAGDIARINHLVYGSEEWFGLLEKANKPAKTKKTAEKPVAQINRDEFMRPEKGVVSAKPSSESNPDCTDCDTCIHQEVLEFLVNNRPELSDLVNETLKMKAATRNVRSEMEKLGWAR